MAKRLALTVDGNITYCTATDENIGKGRCNHIGHQKDEESQEDFVNRIESEIKLSKIKNLKLKDLKNMYDNGEDLELLKQLENEELIEYRISKGETDFKDVLNTENTNIKFILIGHGLHIDEFKNDEDPFIREEVAEQGYALEDLVNDNDGDVRASVASHGYGLEKLIDDDYDGVRVQVALQGYGLDKLINDESAEVREAVAEQGYGLDRLIHDPNYEVRYLAREMKKEMEENE